MIEEQKAEVRIQGIKIVSCIFDGSGYGQGVRNYIRGLYSLGVPMWIQPISFEQDRPDFTTTPFDKTKPELGSIHDVLDALCRTPRPFDVNLIRLSPEVAVKFIDPTSINICHTAWETDRLDPHWTECCNKFNAIFVESEWAVGVFKNSGVTVPVYCVPNCEDVSDYKAKEKPGEGPYKFYSILQWTERKNGIGLLKAYYNAFTPEDDVLLVLKTYLTRVEQEQDQREVIANHIKQLKESMNMIKPYPPVYLITEKLTDAEMVQMHEECDCYAMLDRGESWGIPYAAAAAAGNPIIATNWGGTRQFLNNTNSFPVDYQLTYVDNMLWSQFYRGFQKWAEPNLPHAAELMRYVFDNRADAFSIGQKARLDMAEKFNQDVVTKTLLGSIADVVANTRGLKK
jgi:glycosyltransferase involved in cell wall biosynthesis